MAKAKSIRVRLARVANRPLQMWYTCPRTGKQIRRSAGTTNLKSADQEREKWEAELRLGIQTTGKGKPAHAHMTWELFRHEYTEVKLSTLRIKSALDAESRLDICAAIVKPTTLADMVDAGTLHRLQTKLLDGAKSRHGRPRSTSTVRGYMRALLAALRWAKRQGWIDDVPGIDTVEGDGSDDMKGRPLVGEEVDRVLDAIASITGDGLAPSWKYLIRGVLASGLRLSELMSISWDVPQTIQPIWRAGRLPVLWFPGYLQKNRKSQEIPLCPWFESLLLETPEPLRTGWVFEPESLERKVGRRPRSDRLSAERVGKILVAIGKKSGVIVDDGNPRTGSPKKYASCHDFRRTFATNLYESELPPELIRKLMRHSDIRTTERFYMRSNVQKDAGRIRELLNHSHFTHTDIPESS